MSAVLSPLPARRDSQGQPEVTKFFPKPGRAAPARLQLVSPNPFAEQEATACVRPTGRGATWNDILRMRGELPSAPAKAPRAPRTKEPAPFVPPYLRSGYWSGEVPLGSVLHERMRQEMGKEARIRPCPPTLAKLLATPEWKGSTTMDPTEHEIAQLEASARKSIRMAEDGVRLAKGKAAKIRACEHEAAHRERLERVREAIRVVHPSGAVLLWLPL